MSSYNLLIIDDDKRLRELLQDYLSSIGNKNEISMNQPVPLGLLYMLRVKQISIKH